MGNGTEGTDEGKPLLPHLRKPTDAEIENRFRYHPPKTQSRIDKHAAVSAKTEALAKELRDICPASRGLSLALTAIEEARMWANQALACDSPNDE